MPRVVLGEPPALQGRASYRDYEPWLLEHFFDHVCAYCLLRDLGAEVEHYEPTSYAPGRRDDPTNLLLACGNCNGPGGKGDYHPDHGARRRKPHDTTGYRVLDIREDDFAEMMALRDDGQLEPRGTDRDRAAWNIALLKLDLRDDERAKLLRLAEAAELALEPGRDEETAKKLEMLLAKLTPDLVGRALLLEVLAIPMSAELRAHLRAHGAPLSDTGC